MENIKENILGYEKIGKLIRKFSIPCIISLLVNSLYNIVDQIFIGWGVGYLGNGATNVVFPLTMICLAFSLMFGDGSSSYLSLKLGEKKQDEACKGVVNGILLAIIISVLFCTVTLIFLPQLLNLFGATENLMQYALDYGYIIAIGIPFMMIGTTLNSIIRADGNPKYAMLSMVLGAILNVILDPIFIFVFNMGIKGAAIATIISQILTFIMNILYIKKFKSIKITKANFKMQGNIAKRVTMLGISSFVTQMSFVLVATVENKLFGKYGPESEFGADIPITVLGIVMKVNQILNSIILGIAVGAQPIIGYNYGAKKYDRVKETLKKVIMISLIISITAFILFQTIPNKLINIFGSSTDENYINFACLSFRIFLMLCVCNGVQIPAGIIFQAIGKSSKSVILSLSRQIILLIPAMLIFSSIFGIIGILYAGPFADGIAFLIAVLLLIKEVNSFGKEKNQKEDVIENINSKEQDILEKQVVITISREYGSGGRYIGKLIADKLKIKLYDKDFILKLAQKTGLSEEYIKDEEQKITILDKINNGYYIGLSNTDELFIKEAELIKELADKESCVIVGRCADFTLKDRKNVLKVFIYSSIENEIDRAIKYYGLDKSKAEKEVKRINKLRANHYKYYTDSDWRDTSNYDICINSDALGVEKCADLICELLKEKCFK